MRKLIYILVISFFWACSPEGLIKPYPCINGDCEAEFTINPLSQPNAYQDQNGYWHIKHMGVNYFTIDGKLDELHSDYIINGVPLVEVGYDSDYWVWIDNLHFTVPLYSFLGFFTGGGYLNPIPVGNLEYTLNDMAENHPPLNIVGYQINKHQCMDCPYSQTLFGTYSKYTHLPKQNIFFDNEMVGDTAKVYMKVIWNSDVGENVVKEYNMNIIFE
jgi:hypothetical protein